MELMFTGYILGQYLTLMSNVISWVDMSDKEFFKQFMSEKYSSFQKLTKLLILIVLIATTSIFIERFTRCVSDWSILNNEANQKFDLLTLILGSPCYNQILNPCIPRLVYKIVKLMAKFSSLCLFPVHLNLLWRI